MLLVSLSHGLRFSSNLTKHNIKQTRNKASIGLLLNLKLELKAACAPNSKCIIERFPPLMMEHVVTSISLITGVPYSEHSSFSELRTFVQFIRPTKIIPTVFGGTGQRISDMQNTFKEWLKK